MKNRILWIEDESNLLKNMLRILIKEGFVIDNIDNKKDAIIKIDQGISEYDLIILDIILPSGEDLTEETYYSTLEKISDFEGIELIEYLKNHNPENVPIVIITIISQNEVRERITTLFEDKSYNIKDVLYKSNLRQSEIGSSIYNAIKTHERYN
jgi:CheY-like chemotaxis protein